MITDLNRYQVQLEEKRAAVLKLRGELRAKLAELSRSRSGKRALFYQARVGQQRTSAGITSLIARVAGERERLAREAERKRLEAARRAAETRARAERLAREAAQREGEAARREGEEAERQALAAERAASQAEAEGEAEVVSRPLALDFRLLPPVEGGVVSLPYGGGSDHLLISGTQAGSPVRAAAGGLVLSAGFMQAVVGYAVILDHGNGYYTVYSNLQDYGLPPVGGRVASGEVIGFTGGGLLNPAEGLVFQLSRVDGEGSPSFLDPLPYIR